MSDDEVVDSDDGAPFQDSAVSPTEDVVNDEGAVDGGTPNGNLTPEQKRLADTEAALKERQREFHEVSRQLAELRGQTSVLMQQQAGGVKQQDVLDDEKLVTALRDDPSKILETLKAERIRMQQQVVQLLESRDQYWKGELLKVDPEVAAMRNQIAELRKDPDFEDFSDAQLARLAKKNVVKPNREYRGAPGGMRPQQSGSSKDITEDPMFKMIYPDYVKPTGKK